MSAVPEEVLYSTAATAVAATQHNYYVFPEVSQAPAPGSTARFSIPCVQGHYLDPMNSTISFRYKPSRDADGSNRRLPTGGGHSLIQRFSVFSSGNLVEQIEECGRWTQCLYDQSCSPDDFFSGAVGRKTGAKDLAVQTVRQGATFGAMADQAAHDAAAPLHVIMPFPGISAVFNGRKYICCGHLQDLQVAITFCEALDGVVALAQPATGYEISELRLNLRFLELSSQADMLVRRSNPTMQWNSTAFQTFTSNCPNNSTELDIMIPLRVNSVKRLMATMSSVAVKSSGAVGHDTQSRSRNNLKEYRFRINGELKPSRPVDAGEEAWYRMLSANHSYSHCPKTLISLASYTEDDDEDGTGTACFSHDGDRLSNKSGVAFAGVSTVSAPPQVLLTFGAGGATANCTVHMAGEYDTVLSVQNGVLSMSA